MSGAAASAGASRFSSFMNHPAGSYSKIFLFILAKKSVGTPLAQIGPKTVFFWAPVMKWCLVAAGLKDLNRPAEKLSVSQNVGESMGDLYQKCISHLLLVSLGSYGNDMGTVFVRYYTSQLQPRRSKSYLTLAGSL